MWMKLRGRAGRHASLALVVALLCGVFALMAAPAAHAQQSHSLRIMSVPPGPGVWYILAQKIKEVVEANSDSLTIEVLPGGGTANVAAIGQGVTELGITQGITAVDAIMGREPFNAPLENVRLVVSLFPAVVQYVVLADSDIHSLSDLKGKRANVVTRASGSELVNRVIFAVNGMSYDDLGRAEYLWFDAAADMMRDGLLEANLQIGPVPHPYTMDLAIARPIRFLNFKEEEIQRVVDYNPGFEAYDMPAGSYPGQTEDVRTLATRTIIVAGAEVPEDAVAELTRIIVENWPEIAAIHPSLSGLEVEDLAADAGVPLHPGAERYFREAGLR